MKKTTLLCIHIKREKKRGSEREEKKTGHSEYV